MVDSVDKSDKIPPSLATALVLPNPSAFNPLVNEPVRKALVMLFDIPPLNVLKTS